MSNNFHENLKYKIDKHVFYSYELTKFFPNEERFGLSDQLRRSTMSVMLNYVEGFARKKEKVKLNFYEISYGSLQETKYIIYFAYKQVQINNEQYKIAMENIEEIAKMLWRTIEGIEKQTNCES